MPSFRAGSPDPTTTLGDLLYRGAATLARLPVGAAGALLDVAGGVPAWLAPGGAGALFRIAGGVPAWLAVGANGALLDVSGGLPAWLPVGATGAILAVSGGAPTWFAIGATGQALRVSGGVPAWQPIKVKVVTYTGDGTDNRNITGVGFQPKFVIIMGALAGYPLIMRGASTAGDLANYVSQGWFADYIQALQADGFQIGSTPNVNAIGTLFEAVCIGE